MTEAALHGLTFHHLIEGGHPTNDWEAVMGAILDWLERYLGPVRDHPQSQEVIGR